MMAAKKRTRKAARREEDQLQQNTAAQAEPRETSYESVARQAEESDPAQHREEIAMIAYGLWQGHGCPPGGLEKEWARAEEQVRRRRRAAGA